jgi:preprotein translocase subunit SecD
MTILGRPGRLTAALLTLGLCAVGTACGDDGSSDEGSLLELRPVLAANPPPCPKKPPKDTELVLPMTADGKVAECLELGKPIVDAEDVRSATVAETPAKEPALSVVLGRIGSANLDGFAKANQGKRLAILADGELVSAPVLNFSSFAGRIQVTGLSKEKTDNLFRRLNEVIKPG